MADLTSETFVRAAGGFRTFDPGGRASDRMHRGTPRAWVFGMAANVYARHCADSANAREIVVRLAGRRSM